MKTIGIDYGKSKIGLALSEGLLAEPYKVIKVKNFDDAVTKVLHVLQPEQADKLVIGISEGRMAKETRDFEKKLTKMLNIPVEEYDETLTTQDAQKLSIAAGINRKKRREMEDAYAAAIMLQNYLDNNR